MGLLQPHGRYGRGDGEVDLRPTLADVPQTVRDVATAAEALGNAVVTVAQWTKMLVVHMRDPLTAEQLESLRTKFPALSYARYNGDPHNPAHDTLFDDALRAGVSFPLKGRFVR
jgi:hypothetical protein